MSSVFDRMPTLEECEAALEELEGQHKELTNKLHAARQMYRVLHIAKHGRKPRKYKNRTEAERDLISEVDEDLVNVTEEEEEEEEEETERSEGSGNIMSPVATIEIGLDEGWLEKNRSYIRLSKDEE